MTLQSTTEDLATLVCLVKEKPHKFHLCLLLIPFLFFCSCFSSSFSPPSVCGGEQETRGQHRRLPDRLLGSFVLLLPLGHADIMCSQSARSPYPWAPSLCASILVTLCLLIFNMKPSVHFLTSSIRIAWTSRREALSSSRCCSGCSVAHELEPLDTDWPEPQVLSPYADHTHTRTHTHRHNNMYHIGTYSSLNLRLVHFKALWHFMQRRLYGPPACLLPRTAPFPWLPLYPRGPRGQDASVLWRASCLIWALSFAH